MSPMKGDFADDHFPVDVEATPASHRQYSNATEKSRFRPAIADEIPGKSSPHPVNS